MDKYFQFARCFRDEDLRSDRQPEFSQIDIEMSFITREQVIEAGEKIIKHIFKVVKNIDIMIPLKRITYKEAMQKYGVDKPDLRWTNYFANMTIDGKKWKALACAHATQDEIKQIVEDIGFKNGQYRIIDRTEFKIDTELGLGQNILLIKIDNSNDYCSEKHEFIRRELIKKLKLAQPDQYAFCWVVDFPLLEYNDEEKRFVAVHHPFTSPLLEDLPKLDSDPLSVRANAYDIVLNGYEIGGGSIRIYNQVLQSRMFDILGITKEQQEERFGFLLKAFQYGPPPHGGMAFGLDRIIMLLVNAESLREVITFPKNKNGQCPLTGAPGIVDQEQLKILGIKH